MPRRAKKITFSLEVTLSKKIRGSIGIYASQQIAHLVIGTTIPGRCDIIGFGKITHIVLRQRSGGQRPGELPPPTEPIPAEQGEVDPTANRHG